MNQVLVNIWNWAFDQFIKLKNLFFILLDNLIKVVSTSPKVASIEQTIEYIKSNRVSISRFGDGEIKLVAGKDLAFQHCSLELQNKMIEVLSKPIHNHVVALPDIFTSLDKYEKGAAEHWSLHLAYYRKYWYRYINKDQQFYNAFISRCYMMYKEKGRASSYFAEMKQIWALRDVLLIEGEKSRLGVGNDLFDNVNSLIRILAPNREAFEKYDMILEKVKMYSTEKYLILLALGPTATILAYDLAKLGYQAIDIGHIDIEYEWYRMGAMRKVPVKDKFVNEAGAGNGVGDITDEKYLSEIICHF